MPSKLHRILHSLNAEIKRRRHDPDTPRKLLTQLRERRDEIRVRLAAEQEES